jgi:hypothetical protein
MRKCPHHVYIPVDIEGDRSPFCSGCEPIVVKRIKAISYECEADETKQLLCPLCCSTEFNYISEDLDYFCPRCGYDNWMLL